MTLDLRQAFDRIGAELNIENAGRAFEIDVRQEDGRETFQVRMPRGEVELRALDVRPKMRHLVLDVFSWTLPIDGRFLCGHDEQHWFVASLPRGEQTETVPRAMESLKPALVRRAQKRLGVNHRRHRRKTAAYVRQGEWFFLPRPMMHVGDLAVTGGELVREGGKPHRVQWIYRPAETDQTFVRGAISHPDHETIRLQVWHRVLQNTEAPPAAVDEPFMRMMYLD